MSEITFRRPLTALDAIPVPVIILSGKLHPPEITPTIPLAGVQEGAESDYTNWLRFVQSTPNVHTVRALKSKVFAVHDALSQCYVTAREEPDRRNLDEALADFDQIDSMAEEDGLPKPDVGAVANARTLLPKLYAIYPVRYHVSPTERGGVSLDPPMKHSRTVSIECAPNDAVYCFAVIDGNGRRAKFYQMDGLPEVFVRKALLDLAGE